MGPNYHLIFPLFSADLFTETTGEAISPSSLGTLEAEAHSLSKRHSAGERPAPFLLNVKTGLILFKKQSSIKNIYSKTT